MEEEIMTGGTPEEGGVIQLEPGNKSFDKIELSLSGEDLQGPQKVLQGNPSTSPLTDQCAADCDSNIFEQKTGERVTYIAMNLEEAVDLFTEPHKNQTMNADQPQLPQTQENTEESPVTTILDSTGFSKGGNSVIEQKNCERVNSIVMNLEEAVDLFTEPHKNQTMNADQPQLPQTQENTEESLVTTILDSTGFAKGENSVIEQKQSNEPACEREGSELIDSLEKMTDALEQVAKSTLESEVSQASNSSTNVQADIMSIDQSLEVQDDLRATADKTMQPLQEVASEHSDDKSKSNPIGTGVLADNVTIKQNLGFQSDLLASSDKTMQPFQGCAASEHQALITQEEHDQSKLNPNDTNQSVADRVVSTTEQDSDVHEELKSLLTEETNEPADISIETNKCEPNKVNSSESPELSCMTVSDSQNVDRENREYYYSNEKNENNQNMLTRNSTDNHVPCSSTRRGNLGSFSSNSEGEDQLVHNEEQKTKHRDQTKSTKFPKLSQITASTKALLAQPNIISTIPSIDNVEKNEGIHVEHMHSASKSNQEHFPNTAQSNTLELSHKAETLRTTAPKSYKENYTAISSRPLAGQLSPVDFQLEFSSSDESNFSAPTPKFDSMDIGDHNELGSNVLENQMPKTSFLEPTTFIWYNDEDDSPEHHPPADAAENIQSNLSTEPNRLDGQILNPPVKTPMTLRESIIKQDDRNQKKSKFNSNAASNNNNVPCSDERAGIILKALLEKRSVENAMTLGDINEAILQGKPVSPMIYIVEVESKKTTKPKELDENHVDLQECDGENQIMLWITGSNQLKKYLCWPCLLFGDNLWQIPISGGLGDIVEAAKNHQNSEPHMTAFLKFLVHETKIQREQEAQSETELECKRQTEHLLRLLIEITCSNMDGTPEEHAELLRMACSCKAELQEFIEGKYPNFFVDFVTSNLSPILGALEQLLVANILEEIKNVPFVAIIFEDTTDVVDKSLIAVILRYVTDYGNPEERFVKLMKLGMNRTVADFLKTITIVVQEYQLTEKLVGFTYNGTVISPKEILIFNKTVSRIYPMARFFPYQEHNLKKLITQSLSHLPECRDFFYTINELAGFLKNGPNVMKTLTGIKIVGSEMQKHQWDFENGYIYTIKCHFELIISFFDQVMGREFEWDSATVMHVKYFSRFLMSPNCRVLLMVISAILDAINDLCNAMESNVDIDSWTRLLAEATNTLSDMKHFGLSKILHESNSLIAASGCGEVHSSITPELYDQIIESTLLAINHRCVDLEMAFIGPRYLEAALSCGTERQAVFLQRINVSPENFSELENEAKSFFENPLLAHNNLEQSIKRIHDLKLVESSRHLLRFLRLCLTLPTKDGYSSKSSPAVLRLRSYIAKDKPLKILDLMIFMEKDTLRSMQRNEQYYDYILEYCKRSGK